MGRFLKIAVCAASVFIMTGCNHFGHFSGLTAANKSQTISSWLVYWDVETGEHDMRQLGSRITSLSYFAAYFDHNDRLFIPDELITKQKQLPRNTTAKYLTFVNDRQNADKSVLSKNTNILRRLLNDSESMVRHIDDVITLTLASGYDGIEIDYEKIWKDETLSQSFLVFVKQLYEKAQKYQLKVRIVLEPSAPFAAGSFIKGPEYVVMFYNLHGLHNRPGPKANKQFIKSLLNKMKTLPGYKTVAFAAGGCQWGENGTAKLLTEVEARTLAAVNGAEAVRDEDSQCVVFSYHEAGVFYQVWYADVQTLHHWITAAREEGATSIALWRLGGNVSLSQLN